MSLSDFLLSVALTAFKGPNSERADAAKRIERDFGVRRDRTFWERHSRQPVPKFPMAEEPYGSFRVPMEFLPDLRDACAKHMIFGKHCAGFDGLDHRERPEGYCDHEGEFRGFRALPLVGQTVVSMDEIKTRPERTMDQGIITIARTIGQSFDWSFLRGDPRMQPVGILSSPATATVDRLPKLWDNLQAMRGRFVSEELSANHLWIGSDSVTFWGIKEDQRGAAPIRWTNMLPTLLNRGCLVLVDPSAYAAAIRWEDTEIAAGITAGSEIAFFFAITGDGAPLEGLPREDGRSAFVALGAAT
jgi:hypothetical protein